MHRAGVALAIVVALGGCSGRPDAPPTARPNLVLITLDTVRADHLGCYGDRRAATPRIDALAGEGTAADAAIAVAPLTLPSHASILTGLYPPRHGVRDNADFRLPEPETTLAEHLKAQGYATAAVVASLVLASGLGLEQGFDTYTEPRHVPLAGRSATDVRFAPIIERPAGSVTDDAIAALGRIGARPFFLWVHYYDPHYEYAPPEPYASRFADRPYDGEIAYTDAEIGRLLDALGSRGVLDRTLVVLTADHGESLGEHGEDTHGLFVYDATIRVPLVLRLPGVIPAGRRYAVLMSSVDLAPTVLDLMGLPSMARAQGVSHATGLRGGPAPSRDPVYAETVYPERAYGWSPLVALRGASEKFIEAPEPELYDLAADPGENANLADASPERLRDWKRRLLVDLQAMGEPDTAAAQAMTPEQRANLESLGYVTGTGGAGTRRTRPDPKRLASVHNRFLRAKNLVATGRLDEVDRLVGEVLEADPENPAALALRGTVRFARGSTREGLAGLEAAARAAPTVFENQWNLANALHLAGRHADAVKAYRAAIAVQPSSGQAHHGLGNALYALGDVPGAVAAYLEAVRRGAATPALRASLGAALADAGDAAGAERELRAALAGDAGLAEAWNKLGVVVEKSGRRDEAVDLYGRALSASPDMADALFNRGKLLLLLGRTGDASRDASRLVERHPDYAAGWFLQANVLAGAGDRNGARSALRRCLAAPGLDPRLAASARTLLARLEG